MEHAIGCCSCIRPRSCLPTVLIHLKVSPLLVVIYTNLLQLIEPVCVLYVLKCVEWEEESSHYTNRQEVKTKLS